MTNLHRRLIGSLVALTEDQLQQLPMLPALGFAVRCAMLASPHFENSWDDHYEDAVDGALDVSLKIATTPMGNKILGPAGYGDFCADLSGFANNAGEIPCARAANSAAGTAYCADMVADLNLGYKSKLSQHFHRNLYRAYSSAAEIEGLQEQLDDEFQALLKLIEEEGLTEESPLTRSQIESGFTI